MKESKYPMVTAMMAYKGITREALARAIGVSDNTLRNWLRDRAQIPLCKAIAIKNALDPNLSLEELYDEKAI